MLPIVLLVVIQSVLLLVIPGVQNRRIQQFSLYSVTEQIEHFNQNVPDLDPVSPTVRENKLQSVCSQVGVWAFFTGKNYTTVNSYGYHPATPGWTCSKRRIMADWQSPFRSIRHLGNVDLDTPSISLYKDPFFASEELYVNGYDLSIAGTSLDFASFGFTGRESWTLYSEGNFTGESVCLLCKCDPAGLSIGVTYTAKLSLSGASVRRGCFGTQVLRPTGVLESRVPSPAEANLQHRNFAALSLSNSEDVNASIVFSGTDLRLPCKKSFDTFQISKKSNWTVFGGNNFDGPSACLVYSPSQKTGRGGSDIGSDPKTFPPMSILSVRFGCPQNIEKKNAHSANPVPIFIATEKGSPPTTTTTSTPPSRDGRGREIGPVYIPGDNDGFIPKDTGKPSFVTTSTKPTTTGQVITSRTTTSRPTTSRGRVTPPTGIEGLVSTGSAIIDNQLGTNPTTSTARPGRTEIPPRLGTSTKPTTTTRTDPTTTKTTTKMTPTTTARTPTTTKRQEEVTESAPIREHHGNDLDARPPPTHSEAATVKESGTSGMFFTAFLIILGILVTAMIVTIAVFIYLRATRSGEADME